MRTTKDISTISYNTKDFLVSKLNILLNEHTISDYMFIEHQPESDETKAHFHLYLKPNTLIDTMELQDYLREYDTNDLSKKPLGVIDFKPSNPDDWILYVLHFPPYLLSKGEKREFVYQKEQMTFADDLTFEEKYRHAFHGSEWAMRFSMLQNLKEGLADPAGLILNGSIPLAQANNLRAFYFLLGVGCTDRNGRKNHD